MTDGVAADGPVIGLEVTRPDLRRLCEATIDPQHGEGGSTMYAAIDVVTAMLTGTATLATESPDLDSLGSMAVLDIAMGLIAESNAFAEAVMRRIELIGIADRFDKGPWPGRRPLPTLDCPWGNGTGSASDTPELLAVGGAISDRSLSITQKVDILRQWLATGEEPAGYREAATEARLEMIRALHAGEIIIGEQGLLVTVRSRHRAGLEIGYYHAPVVVALNDQFIPPGGDAPQRKFTIAQFRTGHADLQAVWQELSGIEPGWNGGPAIGGSPRENGSELSIDEVAEVVREHLV